jgi:single-strand DNA-binding protein
MANLNKVMLIGRLTAPPEAILGGKGAKFRFAVNNRKLNQDTQQWEDVPVFLDVEIWNRGEMGKQADRILQTVTKGQQIFIEGHLKMDTWDDKNGGGKRSKIVVVVENFQYLDARTEGSGGEGMARAPRPPMAAEPSRPAAPAAAPAYARESYDDEPADMGGAARHGGGGGGNEDDIPF